VREWLDGRAYETDDCETFPFPQGGSQMVVVPYLPKEATAVAADTSIVELSQ
jgi:hypothetical protein